MTWLIISTAITAVYAYGDFKDNGWEEATIPKIIICFVAVYVGGLIIGLLLDGLKVFLYSGGVPRRWPGD